MKHSKTRKLKPTRERATTIADDGSRNFLRPADVSGKWTRRRRIVAAVLILTYVSLPWIPINGYPAVFLDIFKGRFHLFGLTLATQDLWMFFFLITGLGFTLFFVTALFGRLWCGWACPHSVFMEHVYRRIERLLEGPAAQQKAMDAKPWSDPQKLMRRGSKHLLFVLISALIAHVFLSYFVSIPELYKWITNSPTEHWDAFLFMFFATGLIYFNFAWFREQLCLIVCPYGRLQSALVDDDTRKVGYDEIRGEPRGKPHLSGVGDCINCNRCVQVCPTGIDIRQGHQMECIECMNCIDACNQVMDKLGRAPDLINNASTNARNRKATKWFRPRIAVYLAFMLLGLSVMAYSVSTYEETTLSLVRMQGSPFYVTEDNIRNQYQLRILSKSTDTQEYSIQMESGNPKAEMVSDIQNVIIPPMEETTTPVVVQIPKDHWEAPFTIRFKVTRADQQTKTHIQEATFLGADQ